MSIYLATCALQALPELEGGKPPKRMCLVPAPVDGKITGKDGRSWKYSDPLALLQAVKSRGNPLVVDENHAHEIAKTTGSPSPALARVKVDTLTVNAEGEIWGEPDWTPYGAERMGQGAYLGLSPAFLYDSSKASGDSDGDIIGLSSAGMVNEPNLTLPVALNAMQHNPQESKNTMDFEEIRKLLGLPEGTSEAEITAKVSALAQPRVEPVEAPPAVAPNAEEPPAWAVALNAKVDALAQANTDSIVSAHKVAANAAVERFVTEGKIPPTDEAKAYALNQCKDAEGLTAFVKYHESAPTLVPGSVALNNVRPGAKPAQSEAFDKMDAAFGIEKEG